MGRNAWSSVFLCREIDRSMELEGMHGALCFCVERLIGPWNGKECMELCVSV